MRKQVVVAKYKEDVSWVHDTQCPILIYDKAHTLDRTMWPHVTYVNLPNSIKGREAHTYLTHIVENYNTLADVTYFVQGNPLAHYYWWPEIVETVIHETTPLSNYKSEQIPDVCKHDSTFNWKYNPFPCRLGIRWSHDWWTDRWPKVFANQPPPRALVFSSGAQFAVPKHRITHRPHAYYKYLLWQINKEPCLLDAWLFECMWLYIFGDSFKNGFPDRILQRHLPRMT